MARCSTATSSTTTRRRDTFRCPANQTLTRKQLSRKDRAVYYAAKPEVCGACALKMRCTNRRQRLVSRHLHEDAFQRMQRSEERRVGKECRSRWSAYH